MKKHEQIEPLLRRYYEATYGPWVCGDYVPGQWVQAPHARGELLWSYRQQMHGRLIYLIDDHSGWPKEIQANQIEASSRSESS